MHSYSHLFSLFIIPSIKNQVLNQFLKLFTFWLFVLIVNGDVYQTSTIFGHVTRQCSIVSFCSLHIGHIGSTLMFLLIKLSFVDSVSLHAFHMKCFIFCGIFNYHSFPQGQFLIMLASFISFLLDECILLMLLLSFSSLSLLFVLFCDV